MTPAVLAPSSQAEEEPQGSCVQPWASGTKASGAQVSTAASVAFSISQEDWDLVGWNP